MALLYANAIEDEQPDCWAQKPPAREPHAVDEATLAPLFDAYRELRIRHQLDFATYKLRNDYRIFSDAARRQIRVLETLILSGIAVLFFTHLLVAIGLVSQSNSITNLLDSNLLNVTVVWIATFALAARAFEQGLQPEREVERYQQYRSAVHSVLERFDAARSQSQKLRVMRQMEQLAFDEMRNFLLTHERSHFVM